MTAEKKRKGGRPIKLDDPKRRQKLINGYRLTGSKVKAAKAAGVTFMCLCTALKRDAALLAEFDQIEEEILEQAAETVRKASRKDWRAAAHLLACLRPAMWSKNRNITHSGEIGLKELRVVEDDEWYGNRAHNLAAEAAAASARCATESGSLQGSGVRPAVGQNGNGSNGHH